MRYRLTLFAVMSALSFNIQSAQAVNLLNNGELEPDPLAGWDIVNTVTGMPGAEVNSGSLIGFANHPAPVEGEVGFWLRGFAGHIGTYAGLNKMTNTSLIQTVPGVAGQTYTLTGWSKFEGNFSGAVDELDSGSPSGQVPSPTDSAFTMEFLNSGGSVIGSAVTFDLKADRVAQSPILFAGDGAWYQHTVPPTVAPSGTAQVRVTASSTDMVFNIDPQQSGFYDDFSLRASGAPTTELLINGNLNTGSVVSGWTETHFPAPFTGNFQTADFANHTAGGTTGYWLKPFTVEQPVGDAFISQTVPAGAGDYTLTGYSKWEVNFLSAAPTAVTLQLEYIDANEAVIGTDVLDIKTAGQMADNMWRQFTLDATAPAGTVEVRVTAGADNMVGNQVNMNNQSAFWDDLVLESAAPGLPGDHNGDGIVDTADFVAWSKNPSGFGGDPAGYNDWRTNFGRSSAGGGGRAGAVPEPAGVLLALIGLIGGAAASRRRTALVAK